MKLKLFPKSQHWDGFPMKSKKKKTKTLAGPLKLLKTVTAVYVRWIWNNYFFCGNIAKSAFRKIHATCCTSFSTSTLWEYHSLDAILNKTHKTFEKVFFPVAVTV